ncbi:nucleoside-diphosphate sugar epimerase [Solibacillus sp. FSL K6-1523]|uniref:nucleoside-diphosphate sugar epimerase n=1 Tax=Solibacillus sp. FSL K6-1523 TaxID=2921471 RepID=UPI0030FAD7F8
MLRLSWLISMGISLFGVMLIQYFFTMKPDDVAQAGNLGALGLALAAPFILLSLFITYRFFLVTSRQARDQLMRLIYLIFGVAFLIVMVFYAIEFKNDVYASLGGNTHTKGSQIYGFPMLNEYTNHVFINFYTFGIAHAVSGLAATIIGIFKKPTVVQEERI